MADLNEWGKGTRVRSKLLIPHYGRRHENGSRVASTYLNCIRDRSSTVITTFGRDFAMASTLFHRITAPGKVGRMTQTWVRFAEGWRIVVGHVSVIEEPAD